MKILMIMLSMGALVNNQPSKTQLESITKTQVVEQYKIIPNDVIQADKKVIAKRKTSAKTLQKTAEKKRVVKKKAKVKKSVKKNKKIVKKNVKKKTSKKKYVKVPKRIRYNVGEIQSYAHELVLSYGWSEEDYQALVHLWYRESSWNPNAVNKKSGACGLGQANPCSKAIKVNPDYRTNWRTQVRWGLNYIANRYGTPSEAWKHSQRTGWY